MSTYTLVKYILMKNFLLQVFAIVSVLVLLMFALRNALDIPDVMISNATGECVKVINYKEGDKYSCTDMPSKYNVVWVK